MHTPIDLKIDHSDGKKCPGEIESSCMLDLTPLDRRLSRPNFFYATSRKNQTLETLETQKQKNYGHYQSCEFDHWGACRHARAGPPRTCTTLVYMDCQYATSDAAMAWAPPGSSTRSTWFSCTSTEPSVGRRALTVTNTVSL